MEDGPGPAAPDLCDLHDPEVYEGQDGESLSRWVSSRSRGGLCGDPTQPGPGHCDEWHGRDLQPGLTRVSELRPKQATLCCMEGPCCESWRPVGLNAKAPLNLCYPPRMNRTPCNWGIQPFVFHMWPYRP